MTISKPTIFYDGSCGVCSRGAMRLHRTLARRGYELMPLQSPGVSEITGASHDELMREMKLLTPQRQLLGGVDAILHVAQTIWWARPLCAIARLPGAKSILDRMYRFIASNRYRISATCRIGNVPTTRRWSVWSMLALLPALAIAARNAMPAWAFMWTLALAIYFGCKWLTWWPSHASASVGRSLAYLFASPGMDAPAFLGARVARRPPAREWIYGCANVLAGAVILDFLPHALLPAHPLAAGWAAMFALPLMLHFGLFHLIAVAWQSRGVVAEPIMNRPAHSRSLAEFWGRRWNTAFRTLSNAFLFRPLNRFVGPTGALASAFVISGLLHDVVISLPARGGYGRPTLYFLIQFLGIVLERSKLGRRIGLARGVAGRLYAALFTIAPLPLLLHGPFVHRVIVPMLNAVGFN
jgi:predicted DCC family thiol-disulfide oxidoreductase YuxK